MGRLKFDLYIRINGQPVTGKLKIDMYDGDNLTVDIPVKLDFHAGVDRQALVTQNPNEARSYSDEHPIQHCGHGSCTVQRICCHCG